MTHWTIRALKTLLAVLALLVPVAAAEARTLYVANNGVDNAVCGLSNPCRSISRAIANAVARDTIIVGPACTATSTATASWGEPGEETGSGDRGRGSP